MGDIDCARSIRGAQRDRVDVDTFRVDIDHGTGRATCTHPRPCGRVEDARGIPAKLVVVGMTSNGSGIADPDDAGMLVVVDLDPAAPPVMADFARA